MPGINVILRIGVLGLFAILTLAILIFWYYSYSARWIVGYSHADPPGQRAVDWSLFTDSARGQIAIRHGTDIYTDAAIIALQARERYPSRWYLYKVGQAPTTSAGSEIRTFLGLGFLRSSAVNGSYARRSWTLVLPYGLFLTMLVTTNVLLARRILRLRMQQQRRQLGQCLVCGYDLRASPNRCPECGTVPSPAVPQPS